MGKHENKKAQKRNVIIVIVKIVELVAAIITIIQAIYNWLKG